MMEIWIADLFRIDFGNFVIVLINVVFEKMHQTLERVFHQDSQHLKFHPKTRDTKNAHNCLNREPCDVKHTLSPRLLMQLSWEYSN